MWPMLTRWRGKFMPSSKPRNIPYVHRNVHPPLEVEVLEDRLVLDAYQYIGASNVDPTNWNDAANWFDTTNPANIAVPGPGDTASIPGGFDVVLAGGGDTVLSVALSGGSTLTISSSLETNYIFTAPESTLTVTGGSQPGNLQDRCRRWLRRLGHRRRTNQRQFQQH